MGVLEEGFLARGVLNRAGGVRRTVRLGVVDGEREVAMFVADDALFDVLASRGNTSASNAAQCGQAKSSSTVAVTGAASDPRVGGESRSSRGVGPSPPEPETTFPQPAIPVASAVAAPAGNRRRLPVRFAPPSMFVGGAVAVLLLQVTGSGPRWPDGEYRNTNVGRG